MSAVTTLAATTLTAATARTTRATGLCPECMCHEVALCADCVRPMACSGHTCRA